MPVERLVILLLLCFSRCVVLASSFSCFTDGCRHGNGGLRCQSCHIGCYGTNCTFPCNDNCHTDGCNRITGECFTCKPGYYGRDCNVFCPRRCSSNTAVTYIYDRHTGACSEICDGGLTGVHCKDQVCNKETGRCIFGCEETWTGVYCNRTCDTCLNRRCSWTGYCLHGCKPGFYGDMCDKTCPRCWTTGCDRGTGMCEQCSPGYRGRHCSHYCSETCYRGKDGHRHCDRYNGNCLEGCKVGWHGHRCSTRCSTSCNSSRCYSHDGACVDGCKHGWHGKHCLTPCSTTCKESLCASQDGSCTHGCVRGYHGNHCHKKCINCKNDECDQYGRCSYCQDGWRGEKCGLRCPSGCHTCDEDGICVSKSLTKRLSEPTHDSRPDGHTDTSSGSGDSLTYTNTLCSLLLAMQIG
ncbi:scavenger receptor class F member 2-like [Haliotis rubra]|uniref:scavenger receptor class F member 2-like n=1 Tax=Haliotis rubra TaxID=36100 RepID=UPI001EE5A326|nr:scavenger receptor class F member 2-like [Haliotis rubra]